MVRSKCFSFKMSQSVEILFHVGKSQSKGMKEIFNEFMDYLCSGGISQWNLKSIAENFAQLKKDEFKNSTFGNQTDPQPFHTLTGCYLSETLINIYVNF